MEFFVNGASRRNGQSGTIGAAAAVLKDLDSPFSSSFSSWVTSEPLDDSIYPATHQRAELQAIIIALKWALQKYNVLPPRPNMEVTIWSDSKYAISCVSEWVHGWVRSGWKTAKGNDVVNRDLIEEADNLESQAKHFGDVTYLYISRQHNEKAATACTLLLSRIAAGMIYHVSEQDDTPGQDAVSSGTTNHGVEPEV
ncbi:ribonuclease H-like protein [Hypoxylon trugodes]|uniref:ribonuclease H-like protein n=1 Tax=Hypoxylon trugodes TaxID=326681 RepID=UPI00219DAA0B|nr:ribonuclease H-like protein [Hypoxylon trugodes]KAI1385704.1 ribonuclease H-like protein [Hypoxylon trugodes]